LKPTEESELKELTEVTDYNITTKQIESISTKLTKLNGTNDKKCCDKSKKNRTLNMFCLVWPFKTSDSFISC
jgi:hypothetical protein